MTTLEPEKIKQTVIQIERNKIYGNNISNIKLNQNGDEGFVIKDGELVYKPEKNGIDDEFKENWKKIMFGNYFRIIEMNGNKLTVECKNCEKIMKDSDPANRNIRRHLKVMCIVLCFERLEN